MDRLELDGSFSCDICGENFKIKSKLEAHQLSHQVYKYFLSSKSWTCSCGLTFHNENHLSVHQREHDLQQKWHYCSECGRCFTSLSDLKEHQSEHLCQTCQLPGSKKHSRYTSTSNASSCDQQEKEFEVTDEIPSNNEDVDNSEIQICKVCGETYETKRRLECHMKIHTIPGPYPCKLCDASFTVNRCLEIHTQTHAERSYRCLFCPKAFVQKSQLGRHLNIHALKLDIVGGVQRYACPLCERPNTGKRLTQHHFSHIYSFKLGIESSNVIRKRPSKQKKPIIQKKTKRTGRPAAPECVCVGNRCLCFLCSLCGRNFRVVDLMPHLQLHTGQLVHCNKCEKVYSNNTLFLDHIKVCK